MNMFALDTDPFKAVQYHCNSHVCKMIVESCQMLSTVHHLHPSSKYKKLAIRLYKPTHKAHPCTLWCASSKDNYQWLATLCISLCLEYTKRYNGRIHACAKLARLLLANIPNIQSIGLQPFVQCMPAQYKIPYDPVQAYRNYYVHEKSRFAKWPEGQVPQWYLDGVESLVNSGCTYS